MRIHVFFIFHILSYNCRYRALITADGVECKVTEPRADFPFEVYTPKFTNLYAITFVIPH